MSRLVKMPTKRPREVPSSVMGKPETWWVAINVRARSRPSSGRRVTGSEITPFWLRLTVRTAVACELTSKFLWTMPIPPSWAKAMARGASVTVSIGADSSGIPMRIPLVRRVSVHAASGVMFEAAGTRRRSSKVTPSPRILSSNEAIVHCGVRTPNRQLKYPEPRS